LHERSTATAAVKTSNARCISPFSRKSIFVRPNLAYQYKCQTNYTYHWPARNELDLDKLATGHPLHLHDRRRLTGRPSRQLACTVTISSAHGGISGKRARDDTCTVLYGTQLKSNDRDTGMLLIKVQYVFGLFSPVYQQVWFQGLK
jgi:hypothetical protein